jgi:hypothetical protein
VCDGIVVGLFPMYRFRLALISLLTWGLPTCWMAACEEGQVSTEVVSLEPGSPDDPSGGAAYDMNAAPDERSAGLPDLVLDAAYLLDTTAEDRVQIDNDCLLAEGCVTGLGERRVVRFGSRTGNVGSADLRLGAPSAENPYYAFDACEGQYTLVGFARYELLSGATGEPVTTGGKNGFCIRDSEPFASEGGPRCASFDCSLQGIGQGCADNYGSSLECQWVDITDVPDGSYTLRVTLNAGLAIAEVDYNNNVVEVPLEITHDAVLVER